MAFSRAATEPILILNGAVTTKTRVRTIRRSAGGKTMDSCVFEGTELGSTESILADLELAQFNAGNFLVEVKLRDRNGAEFLVHRGRVMSTNFEVSSESGETIVVTSRLDEHMFGHPLFEHDMLFQPERAVPSKARLTGDQTFNEIIDGRVIPNKYAFDQWFIHLDSIPVAQLPNLDNPDMEFWSLKEIIHYLCWLLNPDQTYVRNPLFADLVAPDLDDKDVVRNLNVPLGTYLPNALDRVLHPYGYDWAVDYTAAGGPKIRVFAKNTSWDGAPIDFDLQALGAEFDSTQSEVFAFNLEFDVSQGSHRDTNIIAGKPLVEGTFKLIPGWDPAYDDLKDSDLQDGPAADADPARQDAWRKWVLNENGDYNTWDLARGGAGVEHDFNDSIGRPMLIVRRRRFLPCITLNPDMSPAGRHSGGVDVEFRDSSGDWRSITQNSSGNGCSVLRRECGIIINAKNSSTSKAFKGISLANLEVRVTAAVELDEHDLIAVFTPASETFLVDKKVLHVNHVKEFPHHIVAQESKYFGTARESSAADPAVAAVALGTKLNTQYEPATITGTLHIDGLHVTAEVGKTVTGLNGRNIGFNAHKNVAKMKFPQIKEVQYDIQTQATSVRLEFSQ